MSDHTGVTAPPNGPRQPWAKLLHAIPDDRSSPVVGELSLVQHCLDVGAIAAALIGYDPIDQRTKPTALRSRLARLADRDDLGPVQCARLCCLAALHDLGKANRGFQNKRQKDRTPIAGHVGPAIELIDSIPREAASLFAKSRSFGPAADALPIATLETWFGAGPARELLTTVLCHHGGPPHGDVARTDGKGLWQAEGDADPARWLRELVAAIQAAFPLAWEESDPIEAPNALIHAVAGLTMLADWMGSDERVFRIDRPADGGIEWSFPRAAALTRAAAGNCDAMRRHVTVPLWNALLGSRPNQHLRQSQQLIDSCPAAPTGSIACLEAPTGDGKTEAALYHFLRLFAAGQVDACYFALPTRIAARQLHARVADAVRTVFGNDAPRVVLAVPGYTDDPDGHGTPNGLCDQGRLWEDDPGLARHCHNWAAERSKRYLAACIAIGTIDQALLAGLQVRHAHLRGIALLRSLLVVDEVHASDVYMNTVLRGLLHRHLAAGSHALLLSATLGVQARLDLLHPEQQGGHDEAPPVAEAQTIIYPLLTVRTAASRDLHTVACATTTQRERHISMCCETSIDDPVASMADATEHARRGAKVLVIRNTVRDCITSLRAIEAIEAGGLLLRANGVACPHHARFAAEDRLLLDHQLECILGKTRDPGGRIAVCTSTAEQSLDIDADLLITDLAPMDVLLQRIGRLHRHERPASERPPCCNEPRVIVLTPTGNDLAPYASRVANRHGLGPVRQDGADGVYPELCMLHATLEALLANPSIVIPRDNRRLVELGVHGDRLAKAPFQEHRIHVRGRDAAHHGKARHASCDWQATPYLQSAAPPEERIATRLGDLPGLVRFTDPVRSPFGQHLDAMPVPAWMLGGDAVLDEPVPVDAHDGTLRFACGERRFRYTRMGLELER